MVGRRLGVLVLGGVMVCSSLSCARRNEIAGPPAEGTTADTVGLPGAAPVYQPLRAIEASTSPTAAAAPATSPTDTARTDTAPPDTAPPDTAPPDTAPPDTAPTDTGPAESAALDTPATQEPVLPAPATPPGPPTALLEFTGDTLIHSPLVAQAHRNAGGDGYDFSPMFAEVGPILSGADFAICHLETPVAPPGAALSTYPVYGIPPQIATGLRSAGYDRCSTASNHSLDRGTAGIDATVSALEAAGLSEAGMARTPAEAVASLVDVSGITVAHLSYTFGFNGASLPNDEPWRSNLIDVDRIIAAARDARARGADVVVLNMHWGDEGRSAISNAQMNAATAITASGAVDLIVGEHVHVLQPIEQINGIWVVFGMGNFLSNMPTGNKWPASTQDGMIVTARVTQRANGTFGVERPGVIPTWVDRADGFLIRPVLADMSNPDVDAATQAALAASLARTTSVVGDFIIG